MTRLPKRWEALGPQRERERVDPAEEVGAVSEPITSMFNAASETEDVLIELERVRTALFRCHENFSDELPHAAEGEKLEPWMYDCFSGRAEAYLEMLFVLLESLDRHITELGTVTTAMYAAAQKEKEETPHDRN